MPPSRDGRIVPVTVLLATHNGEAFLDAQIASLAAQDAGRIDVVAGDDGSSDRTREILREWQERWSKGAFSIVDGPGAGFAENFRRLLLTPGIGTGHVAFADQDDVWDVDKLSAAVAVLAGETGPALYCSRTRRVDAKLRFIGYSPLFRRPPHFRNALVQSLAGGNTMVLNPAAVALVAESARRTGFVSHDWWSYLIVSGAGGRVHYDPVPRIAYRQHGANLVGDNSGPRAKLRRLRMVMSGRFAEWNMQHLDALTACADLLTAESRETAGRFTSVRKARGAAALKLLHQSKLYRQNTLSNLLMAFSAFIGKI